METLLSVNRVENDLKQWNLKEGRLGRLFPLSNKELLKEKLQFYETVAAKYRSTNDQEERFTLRLLEQESKRLEKQLYPKLLSRLIRKFFVPLQQQQVINQELIKAISNEQELRHTLIKAGFGTISNKLEEQIKQGQAGFSIPVSTYLNEKEKLDYTLFFVKDQAGRYQMESYKVFLSNENKREEDKEQTFKMEHGNLPSASQAYNLLNRRPIQKEFISIEGKVENSWLQLDFNDKDTAGNYRMKEFQTGYDLKQILHQLPLKEMNLDQKEILTNRLLNGNRENVTFIKEGKDHTVFLEVNPRHGSVNIYDEHYRKISVASAVGNKTINNVQGLQKTNQEEASKDKRKGLSIS